MMTARQAKDATDAKVKADDMASLQSLKNEIERAVQAGRYSVYAADLPCHLFDRVRSMGYQVESYSDQRDGTNNVTVSWS